MNKCCMKRERDATSRCKHCSKAMIFLPGEKPKTTQEIVVKLEKEIVTMVRRMEGEQQSLLAQLEQLKTALTAVKKGA